MKVTATAIPDVLVLEPKVFEDARGGFFESFNHRKFVEATGEAPGVCAKTISRTQHQARLARVTCIIRSSRPKESSSVRSLERSSMSPVDTASEGSEIPAGESMGERDPANGGESPSSFGCQQDLRTAFSLCPITLKSSTRRRTITRPNTSARCVRD